MIMIGVIVLASLLVFVHAETGGKLFLWLNGYLDGQSCHGFYTLFEEHDPSLQNCATRCGRNTSCKTFFYSQTSQTCQGCESAFSTSLTFLPPMAGAKFFYETLGWIHFNGSRYILNRPQATFDVAQNICATHGGHLVNIGSKEENDFLVELLAMYEHSQHTFIGLLDTGSHGNWRWINDGSTPVFTNFEPTDVLRSGDDYVSISKEGLWFKELDDCDSPFLCEKRD